MTTAPVSKTLLLELPPSDRTRIIFVYHLEQVNRPLPIAAGALAAAWLSIAAPYAQPVAAPGQTAAPVAGVATGTIVGRVVDAAGDAPVRSAIVTLAGAGVGTRRVIVDARGRFAFTALPAGSFTITARKTGYLEGAYGKRRPDGQGHALDLRDGERVTDAAITMWRFATISGTVTDDVDEPMFATVQVWRRSMVAGRWKLTNTGLSATTGQNGEYRVTSLPPGQYALVITSLVSAMPASFADTAAAAQRAGSAGSFMQELQTRGSMGIANDAAQGFATTRIGDMLLQPSALESARTGPGSDLVQRYPTVWYPSASSPGTATRLTIGAGENLTGIHLRRTLTRTARVSGVVSGPDGPISFLSMRLVPADLEEVGAEITSSLSLSFTTAMTVSDASGAFTFMAVPPGRYVIRAAITPRPRAVEPAPASTVLRTADGMTSSVSSGPAPPPMLGQDPALWAATPVSVGDQDATGVSVALRIGARVTGRVEFDGTATKPDPASLRAVRVSMQPADGRTVGLPSAYQAQIDPAGPFYTIGLAPGAYILRVESGPRGWSLKSAMLGGRDVSEVALMLGSDDVDGLVLRFTDRPTAVSGTVRNPQGRPDVNATVLVFPADGAWTDVGPSPRRLGSTRPDRSGAFTMTGLPVGDYHVIAIDDRLAADWQDPVFLRKLAPLASRVTVAEAGRATVDLTTAVVR